MELHVLPRNHHARENLNLLDVNPIGKRTWLVGHRARLLRRHLEQHSFCWESVAASKRERPESSQSADRRAASRSLLRCVAPCVTDRVLILIVEQTKAGSPARKQRNLLGLRHRGFSPHFSQTLDTNFTNLHQLAEAS